MGALKTAFRWFLAIIGIPGDIQTVFALLVPSSAAGVVVSVLAGVAGEPLHWIALAGLAAFALVAHGGLNTYRLYQARSLFGKLSLVNMRVANLVKDATTGQHTISIAVDVKNNSSNDIYCLLDVADFSVESRIPREVQSKLFPMLINGGGTMAVTFPGVDGLPPQQIYQVKLRLIFRYGRKPQKLSNSFEMRGAMGVGIKWNDKGEYTWSTDLMFEHVSHS